MDAQGNKIRAISERLRQEILSGKFDGTGRFPSDRMLMRRFAVARATVQAAMKDLQSENLVDRKLGYGTFLTARASVAAARKFGVIVPDAFYPFYTRICRGIDEAARRSGWSTLSVALGTESMRERAMKALAFAEVCVREKVSGVFFQPLQFLKDGVRFNRAILDVFDRARIPVVLLDSDYLPLPQRSDYDLVGIDNVLAGYTLAQHVIAQGAKRIWYFSNPLPAPTSVNRGNGVALAVAEAGLRWTKDSIFFADPTDTRAARRVLAGRDRADAIIAVNDHVAVQLLKTLDAIGTRVPGDILLAGFNGDPCAEESDPPLTTMAQPCEQIGEAAVEQMLRRLADRQTARREILFSVTLSSRASTHRKGEAGRRHRR